MNRAYKKVPMIILRFFFSTRNLLPVNKKTTATNGGLFAGSRATNSFSEGNWLGGAQSPKLFFQCSLIAPEISRLFSSKPVTNGCCQWR
ncbi:hypothetical protein A3409_004926 [Escherichia coli]|nr:hypothetical protein [Escherichia coli]